MGVKGHIDSPRTVWGGSPHSIFYQSTSILGQSHQHLLAC